MMSDDSGDFAPTSLAEIVTGKSEAPTEEVQETATDDKPTEEVAAEPSSAQVEAEETEEVETTEPDSPDQHTRDEKGRFSKDKEVAGLQAALREERQRRQALEQQQKPKEKRDFWENPEEAIDAKTQEVLTKSEQRFFDLTEELARSKHDDYDAVVEALLEDAGSDSALAAQLYPQAQSAKNPAEFLYSFGKNRAVMKEHGGDLGKYKSSVEAPLRKELEASNKRLAELEAQLKNLSNVSSSLNTEQSSTRAKVDADAANEPTPIEDFIGPKRRKRA